ncbi:MAG: helix-turn-helix transcriptional regulator, partial [Acidimicrobiales bacterium]
VYPTLQLLEDSGLVRPREPEGRRTYELTDDGRAEAEQHAAHAGTHSPGEDPDLPGRMGLRHGVVQLHMAARQVAGAGRPDQVERAAAILRQARQGLYQILAEDD